MIQSMTGFGVGTAREAWVAYRVEVRSVNHRFREVVLRLPPELGFLEPRFRERVACRFTRGRLEVQVLREPGTTRPLFPVLNLPVAQAYREMLRTLEKELGLEGRVRASELLALPQVVTFQEASLPQRMEDVLMGALDQALEEVAAMRAAEGVTLARDLSRRLKRLKIFCQRMERRAPRVVRQWQRRMEKVLREALQGAAVDSARLLQEVALLADRRDITEELVRIRSHLEQFRHYVEQEKGAVGRRLDFLVQEIQREMNTLLAKAGDATISRWGVEFRGELERIREQVQNVE